MKRNPYKDKLTTQKLWKVRKKRRREKEETRRRNIVKTALKSLVGMWKKIPLS